MAVSIMGAMFGDLIPFTLLLAYLDPAPAQLPDYA